MEAIAQQCYQAINLVPDPNWRRDLQGQGQFKGAKIFEVEADKTTLPNFKPSTHLLICLFSL